MTTSQPPCVRLEKLFHRRKFWMLHPLAERLGYALISVRRFLKQIGYFRSYTHNGKWYTLRNSPNFDRDGLWHFKGIGFSKHGTLTATIGYLVGRSPAGLSARELTQKLRHPCHAVLTQLQPAGRMEPPPARRPIPLPPPSPEPKSPTAGASRGRAPAPPPPLVKHESR